MAGPLRYPEHVRRPALTLLLLAGACAPTDPLNDPSGDDLTESLGPDSTSVGDSGDDTETSDNDSGSATEDSGSHGIEIAGTWADAWGNTHTITDTTWVTTGGDGTRSSYSLSSYDNSADFTVGQNASDNLYFPGLWSRFDWTNSGGTLYYCQSAYDAADESDATNSSADRSSPTTGGCGGFPWSVLTPG